MSKNLTYPESEYLSAIHSFYEPSEAEARCLTVKLVRVRAGRVCGGACGRDIAPGDYAVCERANVEGEWCSAWTCIRCLDDWIAELRGLGLSPDDVATLY